MPDRCGGVNRILRRIPSGIQPKYVTLKQKIDDPIAWVMSENLHRRHLTPSQRGMCAGRARKLYEEQAKERQKRKPADSVQANLPEQKGQARDLAGKAFGVSGKTVDRRVAGVSFVSLAER